MTPELLDEAKNMSAVTQKVAKKFIDFLHVVLKDELEENPEISEKRLMQVVIIAMASVGGQLVAANEVADRSTTKAFFSDAFETFYESQVVAMAIQEKVAKA